MITHDRWQQIKEIFYSAQDRIPAERSDFLNEVCGDDASMREEVEALLTADADNEDFLTSPAYEFAAGMLDDAPSEFVAGQTFGRYEILCPLGAGGMGQIYLARDTQLGRNIALKLIAQEFAADSRRVLRFEQEARAASALNHPNVCVIHEIGITETGRHFIAMEHIQGATLRDYLARGPLKLPEALQIATQVGAALGSVHAVGIVHRDIKPENIMLRPDGYVKVVDFGLAKLTEILPDQQSSDKAQTLVQTEPRIQMGTVKYMSPEQLRDRTIDERTDIWSLGIVLYEMLTGSTPFHAESRNESIALILSPEPAQLTFPEHVPVQYQAIVRKALAKDANKRYQTISKLTSDLTKLKRELERKGEMSFGVMQPSPVVYVPEDRSGSTIFTRIKWQALSTADTLFTEIKIHKRAAIFAGTTGILGLLLFLPTVSRWIMNLRNHDQLVPETKAVSVPQAKALTNSGTSVCSAISGDGKWVAHAEEQNGKQRLLVMNTASHDSSIAVPPDDVQYLGITFSGDNNYLFFTRQEKTGPSILYRLALLGSNPIKLKTGVDGPISFSPQGDRFAFVRHDKENSQFFLMLSNVDGSNEQVLATRKNGDRLSIYGPAWSPDGSLVVCPTSHWDNGFHMQLVGFDPKDGHEQVIGSQSWFSLFEVAWQGDTNLVVSARDRETSPHQLWRIHFPGGAAEKITSDLSDYRGVSIFGDQIVTVRTTQSSQMWVLNLDEPQEATMIASRVGVNYGLTWTKQNKIVFSSMAGERLNITRIDPDGSNQIPLTHEGDNYTPAASADGRFIVFSSNRNGAFNIWRINADDGSDATQLTFTDGNFYPSCSPDNQWIAYDSIANSEVNVWKVPMNGGEPVKVCDKYRMPVFSPDSQFIACRSNIESDSRDVAIFSAEGGPPLRHIAIPVQDWQRIQWLSNGHELSFIEYKDGYSNIWSYDLDTGESKQLTHFNSDRIYAYAWSPEFKQIACQRGTNISDVTMISDR